MSVLNIVMGAAAGQNGPGSSWGPVYARGNFLHCTWTGSQFVAVGQGGAIITSPDGINWTPRTSGTTQDLYGVSSGGGLIVAVGLSGTIITSPDGITWTSRTSGTTRNLFCVAYSGSLFVVGGNNGYIYSSSDGISWTLRNSTGGQLTDAVWTGSLFVLASGGSDFYTSPNGIAWTPRAVSTPIGSSAITFGAGTILAVNNNGTVATSTDGVTWTTYSTGSTAAWTSATYANGLFVIFSVGGAIYTSPDGVTWTARSSPTNQQLTASTTSGTITVALGFFSTAITSTNSISWTVRTTGPVYFLYGVIFANNRYVAVGAGRTPPDSPPIEAIHTSPDGITWTSRAVGTKTFYGVAWNGSLYAAVGGSGAIMTSPDGTTWTTRTNPLPSSNMFAIVWSGTQFIAGGLSGDLITSPDGITWTSRSFGVANTIYALASSGSIVVAATNASSGRSFYTSSDGGVTWIARGPTFGSLVSMRGIAWAGWQFVAVGTPSGSVSSNVYTSPDGINWTVRSPAQITDFLLGVAWTGRLVVAVAKTNAVYVSPDGLNWKKYSVNPTSNVKFLYAAASSPNSIVVVGDEGNISRSFPPAVTSF